MIRSVIARLKGNGFFANAFYLMASTVVLAGFGFVFWVIVTNTYDPAAVGIATTLLSLSGLLAQLGLSGFDATLVRFLPNAANKSTYISSALIIVAGSSTMLAGAVGALLPLISPSLGETASPGAWLAFVVFTAITALNAVINAAFLAHKRARYILALNAALSVSKVVLPFAITHSSALTIFILAGIAQLIAFIWGMWWLHRTQGFTFTPRLDTDMLRLVRRFSFSMYGASILNLLPPTVLPLIIVAQIGPSQAAFYYMAFTIATMLYTIAYASMQSVFAEGSHNQAALRAFVTKAGRLIAILLAPAALITAVASGMLLSVFGSSYVAQAGGLLQLFAFAALPVAAYSALGAIFKVTKNMRGILCMNIIYAAIIIGGSTLYLPIYGLAAIGWAWLAGNMAATIAGAYFAATKTAQ